MKSDSNFFNIDAEASLEASNGRFGVHVEGKWVILGVLWYVAQQIEAFEDIEEVLETKMFFVAVQLSYFVEINRSLLLIVLRDFKFLLVAL